MAWNRSNARIENKPGNLMNVLKRHRLALGLTQAKLGRTVGVTQSCVQRWESGRNLPEPATFPKLARALQVDALTLTQFVAPDQQRSTVPVPVPV